MSKNARKKENPPLALAEKLRRPNDTLSAIEPLSMRNDDARVRRTRTQLGTAFLNLILEKPVREVTVQDVLDRSGVGRSTFYLHYRDIDDLLLSQLEMFCEAMSSALSNQKDKTHRVAPVAELFAHISNDNPLYRVLSASGHLGEFYELAEGHFARGIEQRLMQSGRLKDTPPREVAARATALAGSMLALLRWWLDRGEKETPQQMDKLFHQLVWPSGI
jgi:AcrR family transcriptional regulator